MHPLEKVMFECIETGCPNHRTQKYYCLKCITTRHTHMPLPIVIKGGDIAEEWTRLRQNAKILVAGVREWLQEHVLLVNLLEAIASSSKRNLTDSFYLLSQFSEEIETYYLENVHANVAVNNIVNLQAQNPQLKQFTDKLATFSYFKEQATVVLWQFFADEFFKIRVQDALEALKPHSLQLLLKLILQKVHIGISQLQNSQQPQNQLNVLENDLHSVEDIHSQLNENLNSIANKEISVAQLSKVEQLRSELDLIGVILIMIKQQQKISEYQRAQENLER